MYMEFIIKKVVVLFTLVLVFKLKHIFFTETSLKVTINLTSNINIKFAN